MRAMQVHLLAACHRRGLPVLCVGGAGAKADPTRLCVCDLAKASLDPLLRAVRHRLRVKHGIKGGVPVLLSTEKPRCGLVTTAEQAAAEDIRDYQARHSHLLLHQTFWLLCQFNVSDACLRLQLHGYHVRSPCSH